MICKSNEPILVLTTFNANPQRKPFPLLIELIKTFHCADRGLQNVPIHTFFCKLNNIYPTSGWLSYFSVRWRMNWTSQCLYQKEAASSAVDSELGAERVVFEREGKGGIGWWETDITQKIWCHATKLTSTTADGVSSTMAVLAFGRHGRWWW